MAFLLVGSLNAQETTTTPPAKKSGLEFGFGPKAAFNWTSISTYNRNKCDFAAGIFADFKFNKYVGAGIEALYSRQGARHRETGYRYTYKFDYINVPLFAKIYIFKGFSFDLGPQFSFLLSGKCKQRGENGKPMPTHTYDVDNAKNFDFSLLLGFSHQFKFGLLASIRYNIGMTNVMDKHDKWVDGSNYNRAFQFSLGWRF